jgi:predicted lipoprotein with Yx(FWY)xxD motif
MALGVVAAAAISAVVMVPLLAAAQQTGHSSSKSTLQERKVGKYGEVLTNSAGYSLYVLSTEQKGKLHCTSSSCLGGWPPLLIGKNAMISAGPGVVGKVSHVARGSKWQVTYNRV